MIVGIDVGRHFVKGVRGNEKIRIHSYVGSAGIRNLGTGGLEIRIGDKDYFIGELALTESMDASLETAKNNITHAIPLLLAAIAMLTKEKVVDVVGGLQISDYRYLREEFRATFERTFTIRMGEERIIAIRRAQAFPQGGGALYSVLLDDEGRLIREDLACQTIGVIDIGYRDCNICVMSSLKYIDRQSKSFPIGIHQAHLAALPEISSQLDILPHEIPKYLEEKNPDFMRPYYEQLARKIIKTIRYFWPADMKVFLAGGGAILLKEYLQEEYNAELLPEPQFANAIGFYRVGKMLWKEKGG